MACTVLVDSRRLVNPVIVDLNRAALAGDDDGGLWALGMLGTTRSHRMKPFIFLRVLILAMTLFKTIYWF